MATLMLSLALNLPVPAELAMTAELNLDGKICSVGAVEEKLMAAKTGGYKHIILPIDNKAQWNNIPTEVKENLHVDFVSSYEDIYDLVFLQYK